MIRVVHPGSGSWIRILICYPYRIPDPGVKMQPDPGAGSAILTKKVHHFSGPIRIPANPKIQRTTCSAEK